MPSLTLSRAPDWGYLLREVQDLYFRSGAGGSGKIRSHQKTVRTAIGKLFDNDPEVDPPAAEEKPVVAHLRRALDRGRRAATEALIRSLDPVIPLLAWRHGYERMPKNLAERYAFAELAGPRGPVVTERLTLGVVLFAPSCTYPAHAHKDITESYYVLSGTVSENDGGVWAPGSLIFNAPDKLHRITVADREPALLLYAWTGPAEELRGQKLSFSRQMP